jgi:hypothetical protein
MKSLLWQAFFDICARNLLTRGFICTNIKTWLVQWFTNDVNTRATQNLWEA